MVKRVKKDDEKVEKVEKVEIKSEKLTQRQIQDQWLDIRCAEVYGVTPENL